MMVWVLVGAALAAVIAAVAARWPVGPARRDRMAHAFARKVDLALSPELVPVIGDRLVRRGRAAWAVYGLALGAMVVLLGRLGHDPDLGGAVVALGFIALVQLGRGLGTLAVQVVDDRGWDRPRVAHLARPRLVDFVTPLELWWTRASALLAVAVAAFAAAMAPGGHGRTSALQVLAACVLVWAVVEVCGLLVARARPAASDVQSLAFDDALRAESLRALLFAACFPLYAVASAADAMGLPSVATYVLLAAFLAGGIPLSWADASRRARQQFRRRLWAASPTGVGDPGSLTR
jgi:hypothetical protein